MRKLVRYAYIGVAWIALAGFVANVYLAGMAVFISRDYWDLHREFGLLLGWTIPILPLLGLLSWIPRRLAAWLAGLLLYLVLHTILPTFAQHLAWIAALHPVSALILIWLGFTHARRAGTLLLDRRTGAAGPVPAETAP